MSTVNGDIVVMPVPGERLAPLPTRRAPVVVMRRLPRPADTPRPLPTSPDFRGRIIDLLV